MLRKILSLCFLVIFLNFSVFSEAPLSYVSMKTGIEFSFEKGSSTDKIMGFNFYRATDVSLTNALKVNAMPITTNTFLLPMTNLVSGKNFVFVRAINTMGVASDNSLVLTIDYTKPMIPRIVGLTLR